MLQRAPFRPFDISIHTFPALEQEFPHESAIASLLRFDAEMIKDSNLTIFSRQTTFRIAIWSRIPSCSTCGTYDCRFNPESPPHADHAFDLWKTVMELFQNALGDKTLQTIEGRVGPEYGICSMRYEHKNGGRWGLEWVVEASEREKLAVNSDDGYDGICLCWPRRNSRGTSRVRRARTTRGETVLMRRCARSFARLEGRACSDDGGSGEKFDGRG